MSISKGRNLNRRWLNQAWKALKPGGRLLISGASAHGVQAVFNDATHLFNNYSLLAYKKGNRVAQYRKISEPYTPPDWIFDPGIAPGTWHSFHVDLPVTQLDLVSLPGIFSYSTLDEGTRLLISTIKDVSGRRILDLGCGYGIIGIYAALKGAKTVDLIDSQLLAIASCQENIIRNRLNSCYAILGDLLNPVREHSYSYILSNPPFHTGIQVDYQITHTLIANSYDALEPLGYLQLVANRFIRYDRLMEQYFGNVATLAQTPGYRVLISQKLPV